jgi:hypothetical membrane protein
VLLAVGWTIGAGRQPPGYNPIRDTISSLAAHGATDRWVMTAALAGVGACYLMTAAGLRPADSPGRLLLGAGGVATLMVAVFPQPIRGNSVGHTVAATIAFVALATWPLGAWRRRPVAPLLSLPAAVAASGVLLGLLVWFMLELHGSHRGLAERAAALAEALWPLAVTVSAQHRRWAIDFVPVV